MSKPRKARQVCAHCGATLKDLAKEGRNHGVANVDGSVSCFADDVPFKPTPSASGVIRL